MINFSILLPTKGRPQLVYRLLESISATVHDPGSVEVILYLDDDDTESHDIDVPGLRVARIIGPPGTSMGRIFKECYGASSGRYIMLMNDDVVFRTKDWDLAVMDAFSRFSDDVAFVYGNDLDQGESSPTFPILSRKVCELMGGVCPEGYRNLHIESHLRDIFKQLKRNGHDRAVYLDDVVFEHLHHVVGKSEHDATYVKKDPVSDDRLFISLDEERRHVAEDLADYIEKQQEGHADSERLKVKPVVSVIIPLTRGRGKNAFRCLKTLIYESDDKTPFEIIVVGGTLADAWELSARGAENVKVIRVEDDLGFAGSGNRAAREAAGDFLIFFNPDGIPESGWIDAMVEEARKAEDIAAVGSKHLNPRNGRVHHAGISFYDNGKRIRTTYIYKGIRGDSPAVSRVREFQAVSGDCILFRKDAFMDAGGFDESLGSIEDIDLCLRMRRKGLKVVYTPEAVVYLDGYQDLSPLASGWEGKVECDLDRLLEEDGCSRRKEGSAYYVACNPKEHL